MLMTALDTYRLDIGSYPTQGQGLVALMTNKLNNPKWDGPYLAKDFPLDPWGNAYVYLSPGLTGDMDLSSYGGDGEAGGEGDSKDINNWEIE